jgi:hypothetical protein
VGALDLKPDQRKELGDLLPEDSVSLRITFAAEKPVLSCGPPIRFSSASCSVWPWKRAEMKIPLLFGFDVDDWR